MNLTAVGSGADSDSSKSKGMDIRDNAGGYVLNSIFTEFPNGILKVEKTSSSTGTQGTTNTSSYGSQALLEDNLLGFFGNIFCYGDEADSSGNYANTQDGVVYDSTNLGDNTAAEVKAVVFASTYSNTADISPLLNNTDLDTWIHHAIPHSWLLRSIRCSRYHIIQYKQLLY